MFFQRSALKGMGVSAVVIALGACTATTSDIGTANPPVAAPVFVSPLAEFLGQSVWTNQEAHQRAVEEFTMRREELIAQCMRQAGFNYQPDLNSTSFTIGTNAFDDIQPDEWDWVAQYGFGIVSGHRHRSGSTFGEREDDPNRDYVAGLSETARAAFEVALNGPANNPQPIGSNNQAEWDEWMKTRGCTGQAIVQAMSESPLFLERDDQFAPLFEARSAMMVAVSERPEMFQLNSEWAHCMADGGHPGLNLPRDATSPIWEELSITQTMIQIRRAEGNPDADGGAALLAELQAREIEVALLDFDCRVATNYNSRVDAIRLEMETQFVHDNRALLEDFRTAAELVG